MKQIPLKKNISRERIKKKAIALLNEKGFSKLSVNGIVEYAGIAKGTFYIYFENKDDLLQEIFDSFFEAFDREVIIDPLNLNLEDFATRFVSFFQTKKIFLIELRELITHGGENPLAKKTLEYIDDSFGEVLRSSNLRSTLNIQIYSRALAMMILDVCYEAVIEENDFHNEGAVEIITDILKRFLVYKDEKVEREA